MPARYTLTIDVASAPIVGAEAYIEPATAPSNYKDPEKIAAYIAEANADRLSRAALDLDLACISMIGFQIGGGQPVFLDCRDEDQERIALREIAELLSESFSRVPPTIITFNGTVFDLPLLMRRARYLGVTFPVINLDRYRSPHLDLCNILSDRDNARRRSLGFYVRRLGWTDLVKPLSGAEEALAPSNGQWAELQQSVRHDVIGAYRLAQWLDYCPKSHPEAVTA